MHEDKIKRNSTNGGNVAKRTCLLVTVQFWTYKMENGLSLDIYVSLCFCLMCHRFLLVIVWMKYTFLHNCLNELIIRGLKTFCFISKSLATPRCSVIVGRATDISVLIQAPFHPCPSHPCPGHFASLVSFNLNGMSNYPFSWLPVHCNHEVAILDGYDFLVHHQMG